MPLLRDYIAEHERAVDLSDADHQKRVRAEIEGLYVHIAKEEDGLFPAALTALDGADWDAAMAGWQAAHPGREMIR